MCQKLPHSDGNARERRVPDLREIRWKDLADVGVQVQLPAFLQLHDGRSREQLADGCDQVDRVARRPFFSLEV